MANAEGDWAEGKPSSGDNSHDERIVKTQLKSPKWHLRQSVKRKEYNSGKREFWLCTNCKWNYRKTQVKYKSLMILNNDASFYVAANLASRKVIEGNKHDIETRKHSLGITIVFSCGFGVWIGVGCPCPSVRNDIVTPRHLFERVCTMQWDGARIWNGKY